MVEYDKVPFKYIRQYARINELKSKGREEHEIVEDLIEKGKEDEINYLNEQFRYSASYLTLIQAENAFPDIANSPEKFIEKLLNEGRVTKDQLRQQEWQPPLTKTLKICALRHEGATVYLKFVEQKEGNRKTGYRNEKVTYASITPVAIHFGESEMIEIRSAFTSKKKFAELTMKLLGFPSPYNFFSMPKLSKDNAKKIVESLSAGLASTHIALPSTVGSLKFNGKKGVDLNKDSNYEVITKSIQSTGLPLDDTMDNSCYFSLQCPRTGILVEATFEINLKRNYFKFTTEVPEFVVDHVLDILIEVSREKEDQEAPNSKTCVEGVLSEVSSGIEQTS
jgi:hypothetical protein